jgi:lipopolysaccharide transport system ATP-binding protein
MSNSISIKVENLSKAYQIGEFTTGTLSRDIYRKLALMRGKEDPFLKIGEANDRASRGESDIVWSLKDINFEIKQGDAVGIIGRNGAGKSTLLKILSRVTTPTSGLIKVKGRIASLLEVGTGFHPELTGRENIFLNGAILGMRKAEIKKHFDAIVDFAGVERYIDTPVKRYSSGMYVRLAFAVAAHLESEILIVDEVLAVGDAEFQKKCLGKMGDVSKTEGRTILFVSHNMDAVKSLCNSSIILNNGMKSFDGGVNEGLKIYNTIQKTNIKRVFEKKTKKTEIYFNDIKVITGSDHIMYFGKTFRIDIQIFSEIVIQNLECSFQVFDTNDNAMIYNWVTTSLELQDMVGKKGMFNISVSIPSLRLYKGEYYLGFYLSDPRGKVTYDHVPEFYPFEVNMGDVLNEWGWADNACKYIENIDVTVDNL